MAKKRINSKKRRRFLKKITLLAASAWGVSCNPLMAATFTVTNTASSGMGSLAAAIAAANANGGADTIEFNLPASSTIGLTSDLPAINGDLSIDGSTATDLTISGNNANRVLFVQGGNVDVKDVSITAGAANGGDGGDTNGLAGGAGGGGLGAGGAVFVGAGANVTLENVTVDSNNAAGGDGGSRLGNPIGDAGGGGGGGLQGDGGTANGAGGAGGGGFSGGGGDTTGDGGAGGGGELGAGGNASDDGAGGGGGRQGDGGSSTAGGGAGGGGDTGDGGIANDAGGAGGAGAGGDGGNTGGSGGGGGGGSQTGNGGNSTGSGGGGGGGATSSGSNSGGVGNSGGGTGGGTNGGFSTSGSLGSSSNAGNGGVDSGGGGAGGALFGSSGNGGAGGTNGGGGASGGTGVASGSGGTGGTAGGGGGSGGAVGNSGAGGAGGADGGGGGGSGASASSSGSAGSGGTNGGGGGSGGAGGIGAQSGAGGAGGTSGGGGGSGRATLGTSGAGGSGGTSGGGGGSGSALVATGNGGSGGDYGGGGGSGGSGGDTGDGGSGGFGGGGAGAGASLLGTPGNGGDAGFGAGGGGGANGFGGPATGGNGGMFGGDGSSGTDGHGGGGAGLGGAIFVQQGGSLTIKGNSLSQGNTVAAGTAGGTGATDGMADGDSTYLNGVTATFDVGMGDTTTIQDEIAGDGGVDKTGTGTLVLNGVNTYTGDTNVNDGTLVLGDSAHAGASIAGLLNINGSSTLQGIGTAGGSLNLNGASTIAPGDGAIGTLNVVGTYTQAGGTTYSAELNAAAAPTAGVDNDLVNVTGNAAVGGTIDVVAMGLPDPGTLYTVVQTTTGVSGTYASVTDNLALRDFLDVYTMNEVQLQVVRPDANYASCGTTFNQIAVGESLDVINATAAGEMGMVIDELLLLKMNDPDQVAAALDSMSGEIHGTMSILGIQNTNLMYQMLSRKFDGCGFHYPIDDLADSMPMADPLSEDYTIRAQNGGSGQWDGWVSGYGVGGSAETDGNAAALDSYSSGGVFFGAYRWMDEMSVTGIFGGVGRLDAHTLMPDQTAGVENYTLGGFFRKSNYNGHYMLGAASVGFDQYETSRQVAVGAAGGTATSEHDGTQAAAYVEFGAESAWGNRHLQPLVAAQYVYLGQSSFTETGTGATDLEVSGLDTNSLRSYLGTRTNWQGISRHGWLVCPELRAQWVHEYLDSNAVLVGNFTGDPAAPAFAARGLDLGRDWALLGAGVTLMPSEYASLYFNYDLQVNTRQVFHMGSGGVQLTW